MLAGYLRAQARWRLDRAERHDGGRNARCAVALIDAAVYVAQLTDDDPHIQALTDAGCFDHGWYQPSDECARIVRSWRYHDDHDHHDGSGAPRDLLVLLAAAVGDTPYRVPRPRISPLS